MRVLAIESTCDETAAAVVQEKNGGAEILTNVTASSAEILSKYGGIVPEVAAREQVASVIPVIKEALNDQETAAIEAIAVAYGPGLVGSLLIGIETAKALALAWKKPLIGVNHMAAHVFANWVLPSVAESSESARWQLPSLPAVGLVVSGGHTEIMLLKSINDWVWLGGTRDDAAGEAYDKAARALGLPYPGGPAISKAAAKAVGKIPDELKMPRPMLYEESLEMSFSGLKTAVVNAISSPPFAKASEGSSREQMVNVLAREFNEAVKEVLVAKTMKAVEQYQPKSVLLAGGVAANCLLRTTLSEACDQYGVKLFVPELRYCTDNAAMIGAAAILRPETVEPLSLRPEPDLEVK